MISQNPQGDFRLHHTISRNVGASMLSKAYYLVTRLIIPPLVLSFVTLEEYGIWSICFILLSILGMSVFGVTNVYVRYCAVWDAKGDQEKINQLLSTGIIANFLVCLALLPLVVWGIPKLYPIFQIETSLQPTAYNMILGTTLIFMVHLSFGVFGYLLQSVQKIAIERAIMMVSWTFETLAIIAFLYNGFGIYSLLYAYVINVLILILVGSVVCYRKVPGLRLSWRLFNSAMLKKFLSFGSIVQITGFCATINRSFERIFSGMFLGIQATGLYEIGLKLPRMSTIIPESITTVLLPTSSHLFAQKRNEKMAQIYFQGSRYLNMLTGLGMGFFAAFSSYIIAAWIGPDTKFQSAATIMAWFTIALQMNLLTGPASAIFRSIKKPSRELLYGGVQLLLFAFAAYPILSLTTPDIASINTVIILITVITAAAYLIYFNTYFQIDHWRYFTRVLIPGFIPYMIGFGIEVLIDDWLDEVAGQRWETLFILFIAFMIYSVIAPSILLFFFCPKFEREQIWAHLRDTIKDLIFRKAPNHPEESGNNS